MKLSLELDKINQKYKNILNECELYVLSYPGNLPAFNLSPWGLEIKKENIISCIDSKHATFFDLLQTLDSLSFGQVGMPMDKWVFFDCGEMVGGIVGLGKMAADLPEEVLKIYKIDRNYKGLVPFSMYIAIPMASGDSWFGHNLCSANSFIGNYYPLSGLALLTKALGLKVLNIGKMFGATQWESSAIHIHSQLADMEVHSSYTPAHSFEKTMAYRSVYTDLGLLSALSGKERVAVAYDFLVDALDNDFYKKMQMEIENGAQYKIVGRPIIKDGKKFLAIKRGE
ncbi:MAG: hypothetical protein A2504_12500 [Bdellovibrionales bacterium RIFOXYD12_FULL_39_22]|nr:MAG: hypothetical protein A2385_00160 [Bdellovibrionales bacterium RIFOXYB1_FULL_39_21]OFZ44069.1 MAG: hypothetical protein A2485_03825 [Bdellovibrionales bacterium RIFOXYC12_FULL_39_17]OFZ48529.1 MAG: hypothetical protein A2404_07245 [Bdellovibrionales bacterium RIFOXYC1_FULL_39_130]OFZ71858.1 MAG: hypothetical protein A2451_15005 [Bdellovibrionales bacterium RIFOXYC2_FULL_39_8]OFZ76717.1 MAG: hypothetical protein A2560_11620 [Bdellovibrionales bacterium RIFOXYD1_FULL_39_84]OFZ94995.1 MAG: